MKSPLLPPCRSSNSQPDSSRTPLVSNKRRQPKGVSWWPSWTPWGSRRSENFTCSSNTLPAPTTGAVRKLSVPLWQIINFRGTFLKMSVKSFTTNETTSILHQFCILCFAIHQVWRSKTCSGLLQKAKKVSCIFKMFTFITSCLQVEQSWNCTRQCTLKKVFFKLTTI